LGAYSYLHGLLVTYASVPVAERKIRLDIIDKASDKISDARLRVLLFLEKGLAALEAGEPAALGYLTRLYEREKELTGLRLDKDPYLSKIRPWFVRLTGRVDELDGPGFVELQSSIVKSWELWGTGLSEKLRGEFFSKIFIRAIEHFFATTDIKRASNVAREWQEKGWLPKTGLPDPVKQRVVRAIYLLFADEKHGKKYRGQLWPQRKWLEPLTGAKNSLLWFAMAVDQKDEESIRSFDERFRKEPSLVLVPAPLRGQLEEDTWKLYQGQALERSDRLREASKLYSSIRSPVYEKEILTRQFAISKHLKDAPAVIQYGVALAKVVPVEEKATYLDVVMGTIRGARLWKEALKLREGAKELGLENGQVGAVAFLAARAYFEMKNCAKAIPEYQEAILKAPGHAEGSEASYKLAQCLLTDGKSEDARVVLDDLAKRNDVFWSPLASNELALMDLRREPTSRPGN
jgi:tetratricopeptide (TPR) repeat protein